MERTSRRALAALAVAAVTLLTATLAGAGEPDWNRLDDPLQGGIGLHAGKIGGTGLAFKWPLRWYLQLQVAGGLWHTQDDQRHNVGVELEYLLRQDPRLRFFLVGGWSYNNHRQLVDEVGGRFWHEDPAWNAGCGVGLEYLMGPRWSLKADLDFTYQHERDSTTIWPQAGVFFYW
ncbi:MAG: hypothetical protein R3D98_04275 [Candidatus Krumholzibacteriia bacterium]